MHRSDVDGVPVLRIPGSGPLRATLRFGVGARDETYRTRGVGRLVAALAVRETRRRLPEAAAPVVSTDIDETRFTVSGTPQEVTTALNALCTALSTLAAWLGETPDSCEGGTPYTCDGETPSTCDGETTCDGEAPDAREGGTPSTRDAETTAALHPSAAAALNARFGAQASGLLGQACAGCRPLTADMLLGHATTWFTRANAVLTLTGPDPVGLRLPLPPGERPSRSAPSARYPRASWTHRDIDGVAVSVEAPVGSAAAAVAHRIVRERMTAALTRWSASAAPAEAATVPHDSATVVRLLHAPAPVGDAEAVAATVWAQALRLARIEPEQHEVDRHRDDPEDTGAPERALDAAARTELFGSPALDEDTPRNLTPGDVRDAWQRAMAQAQLVVPDGLLLHLAGPDGRRLWCTSCWTWDELPPWGREFRAPLVTRVFRRPADRHWTVLTPDSVVTCTTGAYHALLFDDVLALERRGTERVLTGRCGCDVGIDPAWYRGGRQLVRALDEAVPAELAFDAAEEDRSHEERSSRA